jgi:hypothetical protein
MVLVGSLLPRAARLASPGPEANAGNAGRSDFGLSARTIRGWHIDRERFVATPVMSDGSIGPALELRDLFQSFYDAVVQS